MEDGRSEELRLDGVRARVRRIGLPSATLRVLGRIAASLAVAGGITGLLSLLPKGGEGPFIAMAVLTLFGVAISVVAFVPLVLLLAWSSLTALLARAREGSIIVAEGALHVASRREAASFACAEITSVFVEEPGQLVVRMEDGDVVVVSTSDHHQATALADAVARASGKTAGLWASPLYAPAAGPAWVLMAAATLVTLGGFIALALVSGPAAFACFVGGLGSLAWLTALRPRPVRDELRLGADGVAVRSDVGTRFIAFARMAQVEAAPYGASVTLADGEVVPLAVAPPAVITEDTRWFPARELAKLRRARLLAALESGRAKVEAIAGEERVARQGRTIADWRAAMRELVRADAPGYRAAVLPAEQAVRIVESGHATPEARIGAALALASSADVELKRRLRVALQDSVDDSARKAISDALDDRLESWRLEVLDRRGEGRAAP